MLFHLWLNCQDSLFRTPHTSFVSRAPTIPMTKIPRIHPNPSTQIPGFLARRNLAPSSDQREQPLPHSRDGNFSSAFTLSGAISAIEFSFDAESPPHHSAPSRLEAD